MATKKRPRRVPDAPIAAIDLSDLMADEQHIAAALYMITRAAAGRYVIPDADVHALLRDAAMHCEAARLRCKEERTKIAAIGKKIFGEDKRTTAEKVLDALRHLHPRYRDATPDEIAAALFSVGL